MGVSLLAWRITHFIKTKPQYYHFRTYSQNTQNINATGIKLKGFRHTLYKHPQITNGPRSDRCKGANWHIECSFKL